MKKNKFLTLVAIVSLAFTSCSSEESLIDENQNPSLKKTYKVKRDATGAYSLDFDNNTKVDQVLESSDNTRQYLISSSLNKAENSSQELLIDNNKLKVGFIDTDTDKKQYISIFDDNISLQSKSSDTNKLADYSIQSNQDGTFSLDFNVNDNVNVSFVYNEEISTHEIHLEDGIGGVSNFSRTLESIEGEPLKIDFVNHINNPNAKSYEFSRIRKPVIIIDDGEDS